MENHKNLLRSYVSGFVLSVILTIAAYIAVEIHVNSHHTRIPHLLLTIIILGLAFIQLIVQMVFFLHMGKESQPRWKLWMFILFIGTILTVVVASIWIMNHLNYQMNLLQLNNVMQNGEGF